MVLTKWIIQKELHIGINAFTPNFKTLLSQTYEFTDNSNFHSEGGNENNLSDILGSLEYKKLNEIVYNFRYDLDESYLKKQNISFNSDSKYGNVNFSYLDQNSKINNIISKDIETFSYSLKSKKINKYSKLNLNGLFDLKKDITKEYSIGYSYFDECFVQYRFYKKILRRRKFKTTRYTNFNVFI